jgi:AAA domain
MLAATFATPPRPLANAAPRQRCGEPRWTCRRRNHGDASVAKTRSRSAKRTAVYTAMDAYAAHFAPLLRAELEAEQDAYAAAAARGDALLVGVRAEKRPRVFAHAVYALRRPARSSFLGEECHMSKGDLVAVRSQADAQPRARAAGFELDVQCSKDIEDGDGDVEATVLERSRWEVVITVPIGSEAARRMDCYVDECEMLCVEQGTNATANERAVAALTAVTAKGDDQSAVANIVVRSFEDNVEPDQSVLRAGPNEQAVKSSVASRSAEGTDHDRPKWEQASSASASGLDKSAVAAAVRQICAKSAVSPNPVQRTAIKQALSRTLSLIQGPPGTGKTITAARIVVGAVYAGCGPVLAVASSNVAVDNLVEKVLELLGSDARGAGKLRVVRLGRVAAVSQQVWGCTLEGILERDLKVRRAREDAEKNPAQAPASRDIERAAAQRIVRGADIVMATCVGAGRDILDGIQFRFMLCDEATQCTEPDALIPLTAGGVPSLRQLVLVGDHHQLPPTVMSIDAAGLTHSLFERMWRIGVASTMLDIQYRMHPDIVAFPARYFYFKKLSSAVDDKDRPLRSAGFDAKNIYHQHLMAALAKNRVLFINVPDGKERVDDDSINTMKPVHSSRQDTLATSPFSFVNEAEASIVLRAVCGLPFAQQDIGVISPYAAQTRLLSRRLKQAEFYDVEVSTVDGFQGREKNLILFSAVRNNLEGRVGFLSDWRRLNVAMTRAKTALIVVGSAATLRHDRHWAAWMRHVPNVTADSIKL